MSEPQIQLDLSIKCRAPYPMKLLLGSAWSGVQTFEYPKSQILISGRGELSISTFSSLMSLFATPYTVHKLMSAPSRLCLSRCSMASD